MYLESRSLALAHFNEFSLTKLLYTQFKIPDRSRTIKFNCIKNWLFNLPQRGSDRDNYQQNGRRYLESRSLAFAHFNEYSLTKLIYTQFKIPDRSRTIKFNCIKNWLFYLPQRGSDRDNYQQNLSLIHI